MKAAFFQNYLLILNEWMIRKVTIFIKTKFRHKTFIKIIIISDNT